MTLTWEPYQEQNYIWPKTGRHILAHYDDTSVVVYQAYRPAIGEYAVEHQRFGGDFSLNRMSWIKPNFLWMMYRSAWGTKEGQEVILAVWLRRDGFDDILRQAVPSSHQPDLYPSRQEWSQAVARSDVRLQWDPDHGPGGAKVERRAIQLGLRGKTLKHYATTALRIEDISGQVAQQRKNLGLLEALMTPRERGYPVADPDVARGLGL